MQLAPSAANDCHIVPGTKERKRGLQPTWNEFAIPVDKLHETK